jgi:23S rRNA (cytidine1920-2'-O)/16S rRNA (cytidine1409-2'-O)-methyltransferase
MPKERLDLLLVERSLAVSRNLAQRLIMAGQVRVNGQIMLKSGTKISPDSEIQIIGMPQFVSRGGEKLAAALEVFPLEISGKVCADVGSSTGGFTDCLLQNGARKVYAIDVGKGILHWKLRQDPRLEIMEETNARYLDRLPEAVEIVTVDASFISLKKLIPVFKGWFHPEDAAPVHPDGAKYGDLIALIKPQFEAGRQEASRGQGVIRDQSVHRRVLIDVLGFADQNGYQIAGLLRSPLTGPKGNIEFLSWMVCDRGGVGDRDRQSQSNREQCIKTMTADALK